MSARPAQSPVPIGTSSVIMLRRAYPSRHAAPLITAVKAEIFHLHYFTHCSRCDFCGDACCDHGVDIDVRNVERILAHGPRLEQYVGLPARDWFTDEYEEDKEFPGGAAMRTAVRDGACVFRNPAGRGCLLHSFCVEHGMDYHELKPMVSALFPVTFEDGVLCAATEVEDGTLVCSGAGPTLYRGIRAELLYYFGEAFVLELDAAEASEAGTPRGTS